MEITLHDFKYATIAQQAVDLIESHLPKNADWKITSVEIGAFAHSIDIGIQLPYKQRSSMGQRWTLDELMKPGNRPAIKTEVSFFVRETTAYAQVRFRNLVDSKDVIVTIPQSSENEIVTFIINY